MEYPCSICSLECLEGIYCSNCKNWVHSDCANLNSKDLKTWSAAHLNFLCKCCVFSGINYDASAALSRLHTAITSNRKNALTYQGQSESKLLQLYNIELSQQNKPICTYHVDDESVKILSMYQPIMNSVYDPIRTVGDGNCMYRAISSIITGSEEDHVLLRLFTALELINNRSSYDTKKPYNDFLQDCRIVTSIYEKLVIDAIKVNTYSEMAHVYALTAALGEPIQSYFPPQIKSELSAAFTRTVVGRDVPTDIVPQIMLMWSSVKAPITLSAYHANHFVPLLSKASMDDSTQTSTATIQEPTEQDEQSVDNFPLYSSNVDVSSVPSSFGQGYGCETLDDPVTLSDISVPDLVTVSPEVSNPSPSQKSDLVCTSQPDESEMHGVLESGFLDTSNVITQLLKDVPGLAKIPPGSKENVYFILDNKVNAGKRSSKKRSAFSDDRGVWNSSSGASPKSHYILHANGDLTTVYLREGLLCSKKQVKKQTVYTPLNPQPQKEQVVVLQRYYTNLKQDKGYKTKVTWLGEGGLESTLAVVEYVGKFPGHAPHGLSSDETQQYVRKPDYVMDEIERLTKQKCKPADIYLTLKDSYDETTRPEIDTIYQKARYVKSKTAELNGQIMTTNIADQICHLENLVTDNDNFVKASIRTGGKTPTFLLYTDEQIDDIRTMCCTGRTVLGVDKTFNLCKMHVTVTCFKQLTVTGDKTNEPPLFIGPMFVHDNSDYETYSHFSHHLRLKLGTNLAKLVIGSDEEQAMVKAIMTEFPCSSHVLCTRHLKENTKQHMIDQGVPVSDRQVIMGKIFGTDGLVNATDDACFETLSDDVVKYCTQFSSKFVQYFSKRLCPNLKSKVNIPMREGLISSSWTNNNSESINHVLKQTVNWETKSLSEFVRLTKRVVMGQYQELRSALLSTGKYRLAVTHKHFEVSKASWMDMTEQERTKLYRRYRQHVVKDDKFVTSTDGRSTVVAPKTDGKKPGQRKRKINVRTVSVTKKAKGE